MTAADVSQLLTDAVLAGDVACDGLGGDLTRYEAEMIAAACLTVLADNGLVIVKQDDMDCVVQILQESPSSSPFTNVVILDLIDRLRRSENPL